MENISIFEFIGAEHDAVFVQLQSLELGDEVAYKGYVIRLTDKYYEIENEIEHLGFKTLAQCYAYLRDQQQ